VDQHRRADDPTLREMLEQAVNGERSARAADVQRIEECISAEVARIHVVLGENAKALEHQAQEYQRRLDSLNHEQARITQRDAEFVREKVYEGEMRSQGDKIDVNARGLVKLESAVTVIEVRFAALQSSVRGMTRLVVGVVVTAILGGLIALLIGNA
jgi:hypothetical protein